MKRNKILLLSLIFTFGCQEKRPEALIVKWEKKHSKFQQVERIFASSQEGQCLRDVFNKKTLEKEVLELEKKYADAPRVQGSWKSIDLSQMPVPQANFLKTFGKEIGDLSNPNGHDFSSCQDVPCILNKIYGKEDHIAGLVHYLWYLKFGILLALDNKTPQQSTPSPGMYNGKNIPLEKYLLSDRELYAFWRVSLMLKPPFSTLNYLKEIQRIPRGEKFEGVGFEKACGLASSVGWITLTDNCLSLSSSIDDGYLYHALIHEMGHHVDFEQGRGTRAFYRSHKQDYLDLAGMYLEEYVGEDGKPKRKWMHRPGIRLITPYAGAAPQENFAESLSVFRVDGDLAKENITSEHFNFVSRNYYQDRSFQKEELIKYWLTENSGEMGKEVFRAVLDCYKEPGTIRDNYFSPADFSTSAPADFISCISSRAREMSKFFRIKTMLKEPEGCNIQEEPGSRTKWEPLVKGHLKSEFERYLSSMKKDPDFISRIEKFLSGMSEKSLARRVFISCFQENNEETCYQENLREEVMELILELQLPKEQTKELVEMYRSFHPFVVIRNETLELYRTFVASHEELIRKSAQDLWNGCRGINHDDLEPPTGNFFQVPSGYLVSSFYNCLNASSSENLKQVIRDFSVDGLQVKDPKEEFILLREVRPRMTQFLQQELLSEREIEAKAAKDYLEQDQGSIRKLLLSNLDWAKDAADQDRLLQACKREGTRLITFFPLYHLKSSIFSDFLEGSVCRKIADAPEFELWLENSRPQIEDKMYDVLESKLLDLGRAQAKICLSHYPSDNIFNRFRYKFKRDACLVDEWPALERQVLKATMEDPLVLKYKVSPVTLRRQLEGMSRRIQQRILKEEFNQSLL